MNIVIGRYDGDKQADFYDEKRGIIRIDSTYGKMWLPLLYTGVDIMKFDVDNDVVIALMFSDGLSVYDTVTQRVDDGIAFIVKAPPHMTGKKLYNKNDEANLPTKLLVGGASKSTDRITSGTDTSKIVYSDDLLLMKGPGGQIAIGPDGIVKKGNETSMDFFSGSKAGVLKESFLASIIPNTVLTPFPHYLPDTSLIDKISGIMDLYTGVI